MNKAKKVLKTACAAALVIIISLSFFNLNIVVQCFYHLKSYVNNIYTSTTYTSTTVPTQQAPMISTTEQQVQPTTAATTTKPSTTKAPEKPKYTYENLLVNFANPIPSDYKVKIVEFTDANNVVHEVSNEIVKQLNALILAAKNDGVNISINSAYRSRKEQKEVMKSKILAYQAQGYSYENAVKKAEDYVAKPGTSEHETGLAIDFGYYKPTSWAICYDWLEKNAHEFGFILRYPDDKINITNISNEPWHYRYVGKKVAKEIYKSGLCLEEYLSK